MDEITKSFQEMLIPQRFSQSKITNRPKTDPRTSFESDYSRVVMSAPVRRLQDKAQVFPLAASDFVRTRLTHSMEVSRFARDMGRGIECILHEQGKISDEIFEGRWISSILETAGLIHDIGNPPFGHMSEKCISTFFANLEQSEEIPEAAKQAYATLNNQERADFEHFDGNVQGLRILLNLGVKDFNLTMPTLSTLIKYPYNSITGNQKNTENHQMKKYGYYKNDEEKYNKICESLGLKSGQRHPLTFVLEAADDIAYLVCDVEDGLKIKNYSLEKVIELFKEKGCKDWLCVNMKDVPQNELYIHDLRIKMQSQMLNACVDNFISRFYDIVTGNFTNGLLETSTMQCFVPIFKELDILNIKSDAAIEQEKKGKEAISGLLDYYTKRLFSDENNDLADSFIRDDFSNNYWQKACPVGEQIPREPYKKFMLITDHISGMTDTYALHTYQELLGDQEETQ